MFRPIFLSLIAFLFVSGCTADKIPVLPVTIQYIGVDHYPHSLARSLSRDRMLVSCFASESVMEFSLSDKCIKKRLVVRKGPAHLIRDPRHQRIYCLHTQENALAVLGGTPLRIRRKLGTGSITLAGGAIRPGRNELWICDGVSAISVLVTPTIQLKKKIQLGRYPQHIVFSPEGNTAFVTLKGENAVAVVNARTGKKITTIPVGIYPRDIILVGNIACVSNYGSHDISLVDVSKRKERARIRVYKQPNHLTAHKNTLWVSCERSYRLVAIDIAHGQVIGTIRTGFYPGAVEALSDGSLVVAAPRKHKVTLIKPKTAPGRSL